MSRIVERLLSAADDDSPSAGDDSPPDGGAVPFRCEGCDTTYVAVEMTTCSSCGSPVERVPTAAELGFD